MISENESHIGSGFSSKPDPDKDLSITTSSSEQSLYLSPAIKEVPQLYEATLSPRFFETEESFLMIFPLTDHLRFKDTFSSYLKITSGEILFIPSFSQIEIYSEIGCGQFIAIPFGPSIQLCKGICPQTCQRDGIKNKPKDELMQELPSDSDRSCSILPMKEVIVYWRKLLYETLKLGIRTLSYYEFKIRELFFLFREFYSRSQIDEFLRYFHCDSYGFRAFVFRHHWDCKSIEELADLAGLSLSTFKRTFKEEFHTSPLQWINEQKARYILRDLKYTNDSLPEIATRYNFSSVSYLCAFCKKMFGDTPLSLRNQSNSKEKK